jgi:hypothetical protein
MKLDRLPSEAICILQKHKLWQISFLFLRQYTMVYLRVMLTYDVFTEVFGSKRLLWLFRAKISDWEWWGTVGPRASK